MRRSNKDRLDISDREIKAICNKVNYGYDMKELLSFIVHKDMGER